MMQKGFTLIETIVVIAVSVVALLALVNLFLSFNALYGFEQVSIAVDGSAAASMNAMQRALLLSDQVLASHSFSGTTYSSDAHTLVLELPSIDASGNILSAKDYIVYYASSTMLYELTDASTGSVTSARVSGQKQLSSTLSSLSFTYDNTDFTKVTQVTADIQTSATYKQQIAQNHLLETVHLRNK